jgi:hypothetical protein
MDIGGWRSPGLRVAFCRCRCGHPADCAQSRCGELRILSTPARATTSQDSVRPNPFVAVRACRGRLLLRDVQIWTGRPCAARRRAALEVLIRLQRQWAEIELSAQPARTGPLTEDVRQHLRRAGNVYLTLQTANRMSVCSSRSSNPKILISHRQATYRLHASRHPSAAHDAKMGLLLDSRHAHFGH